MAMIFSDYESYTKMKNISMNHSVLLLDSRFDSVTSRFEICMELWPKKIHNFYLFCVLLRTKV